MNTNRYKYIITDLDTTDFIEIDNAPDNWAKVETNYSRAQIYGTLLVQDTLALIFVRDGIRALDKGGYYLISDAVELRGTKARIQIERKELNAFTNEYNDDFIGLLDLRADSGFSKIRDKITVKTIDSGKLAKFIARDEMEIDVFGLESIDGVAIPDFPVSSKEILYKAIDLYLAAYTVGSLGFSKVFTSNEIYVTYYNSLIEDIQQLSDRFQANNPLNNYAYINNKEDDDGVGVTINLITNISGSYEFIFNFGQTSLGSIRFSIEIGYFNNLSGRIETIQLASKTVFRNLPTQPTKYVVQGDYLGSIDNDIPLDGTIVISCVSDVEILGDVEIISTINPKVDIIERYDGATDSNVRGMMAHEIISRGIQLITSETDTSKLLMATVLGRPESYFQSYSNTGNLANEFITNGLNIRGFDKPINISIKNIFKSLSARYPLGLWYDKVNDYFVVEKLEYFYPNESFPFHLDEVGEITKTFATDIFYNSIKGGYPTQKYDELEGINEINAAATYSISIETKNIKDISSPYYGDSVGQELARKLNKSYTYSQDTDYDNNVYITKTDGSETIQGATGTGIVINDGFLGIEQRYNLGYSPRLNLIRWQKFLSSILLPDLSEDTQFRSADKSTEFDYYYNFQDVSSTVNEADNVSQSSSLNIIHGFWFIEFEAPCTLEIRNELKINPHRIMSLYDYDGNELSGYIWELKINAYNGLGQYKLLVTNKDRV